MSTSPPDFRAMRHMLKQGRHHEVVGQTEGMDRGLGGAIRARALMMVGRTEQGIETARTVLAHAVADDDPRSEGWSSFYLASGHVYGMRPLHALRYARRARHVARTLDDLELEAATTTMTAEVKSQLGDLAGAAAALRSATDAQAALGERSPDGVDEFAVQRLRLVRASLALRRGDLDEVERLVDRSQADEFPRLEVVRLMVAAMLASARGDLDRARDLARAMVHASNPDRVSSAWQLLGDLHRLRGEPGEARVALQHTVEGPDPQSRRLTRALLLLVELDEGRIDAAEAPLVELSRDGSPQLEWYARVGLARVATSRGDPARWDAHWEALPSWRGYAPAHLALDLARLASETAARPEPMWAPRAVRVWARVVELADSAGACSPADRARDALTALVHRGAPVPLGPFLVGARIGSGRQAEVRRASTASGREVAVKIERIAGHRGAGELRHAARLRHPRVAPVLAFGTVPAALAPLLGCEADGRWVATPLAGGTLHDLAGQLSWPHLRGALVDVLTGLAHVHARGLLHLDLKPENVLVASTDPLRARLTDFGVARSLVRCIGRVPVAGTPAYMAPEQFTGDGRSLGTWTDLYAVGGLALALATGRPPFHGDLEELVAAHRSRLPDPIEHHGIVPDGFDGWIRGLMAKRPRDRYQRAADALRDLERLGDSVAAAATPAPPTDRLPSLPTVRLDEVPPELSSQPTLVLEPTRRAHPTGTPDADGPRAARGARVAVPSRWRADHPVPPSLDAEARLALLPLQQAPTAGRDDERDALWGALRATSAESSARVVLVEGAPGAGSSHLARWLAERAHALGVAHVWWTPAEGTGDVVVQALRSLLRASDRGPEAAQRLTRQLQEEGWPAELAGDAASVACEVHDPGTRGLIVLTRRILTHLGRERVVLWVVDDLHRAPAAWPLVEALHDLDAPLLVVGTATRDPGSQAGPVLDTLPDVIRVAPGPMDVTELAEIVEGLLPVAPEVTRRLAEASGGWPGALVSRLRALASAGAFVADGPWLRLHTDVPEPSRGEAWADVVDAALAPLSLGHTIAAELLGILRAPVSTTTWSGACEAAGISVPAPVRDELLAQRLIIEEQDGVRPVHPAVAVALRAHARRQGRVTLLHEIAAEVVEEPRARAGHLRSCGRTDDAVAAWQDAAEHAAALYRIDEWSVILDELQATLDDCGPEHPGWTVLLGHRAALALDQGQPERSRQHLRELLALARDRGDDLAEARARLYLVRDPRCSDDAFTRHLAEAERIYRGLEHHAGLAACHLARGLRDRAWGRLERAEVHFERAIDGARDSAIGADAQRFLAVVLARGGRHDEATATLQGAIEDTVPGTRSIFLRDAMATVARLAGDLDEAERHLRKALELRPSGRARWCVDLNLATLLWAAGRDEEARDRTREVRAVVPRNGSDNDLWASALRVLTEAAVVDPGVPWRQGLDTLISHRDHTPRPAPAEVGWTLSLAVARAETASLHERARMLADLGAALTTPRGVAQEPS